MSVFSFASLKGGVGKTSLSINVSHALAKSGARVVLIDGDPTSHASRFFTLEAGDRIPFEAPLARLFLSSELGGSEELDQGVFDCAHNLGIQLTYPVRNNLDLIPGSPELRHFLWVGGARFYKTLFPVLMSELKQRYDFIVFDTAPDFNVITRNAVAASDLVVVPVDSSEMSIHSLEEIVHNASHIKGPTWTIVRSMVNRQASRVRNLSDARLRKNFGALSTPQAQEPESDEFNSEDPSEFLSMLKTREAARRSRALSTNSQNGETLADDSPIYLLNSVIHRTEQQNMLSFAGKTSFDSRATNGLAAQYQSVASELLNLLYVLSPEKVSDSLAHEIGATVSLP